MIVKIHVQAVAIFCCITILSACSSSDAPRTGLIADGGGETPPTNGQTTAGIDPGIVGLFDYGDDIVVSGQTVRDVYYLNITADGRWEEWDYLGDQFDMGENCYVLYPSTMTQQSNSIYLVSSTNGLLFSAGVTGGGNAITISDPQTMESEVLPRVTNISAADFNEC